MGEVDLRHDLDLLSALAQVSGLSSLGREVLAGPQFPRVLVPDDEHVRPKEAPGFNAFQRLAEGDRLWRAATGRGYGDFLDPKEIAELGRFFQQRHILVHDQGIVDQLYLDRSGDTTYRLGQRLVTKPAASRRAADLVEKLARGIGSASP